VRGSPEIVKVLANREQWHGRLAEEIINALEQERHNLKKPDKRQ